MTTTACLIWQFSAAQTSSPNTPENLERKLQRRVSVTWQNQQLAPALQRLARAGDIMLWIDRNVDRQKKVQVELVDLPFDQAFRKIAQENSLGFTTHKNLVYVGPQQTTHRLKGLIEQARTPLNTLPTRLRIRWLQSEPVSWPRLSEPRRLIESWAESANFRLSGSERIPHDLWPQQSLPPLALIDRLTILLAGFDLTCTIDAEGKVCEIVALDPATQTKLARARAKVRSPAQKRTSGPRTNSRQVFTLRLENQRLERVLDKFAQQLKLEIVWPASLQQSAREQLVSCDVKQVDLEELLSTVLAQANLTHQLQGKRVIISTKQ